MILSIFDFASDLQFAFITTHCSSTYQDAAYALIGTSTVINMILVACTIGFLQGKLYNSDVFGKLQLIYWPVIVLSFTSTNHLKAFPWNHRDKVWEKKEGALRESLPAVSWPEDNHNSSLTCWRWGAKFGIRNAIIWATVIFEDIPQIILVVLWNAHGSKHSCAGPKDWASFESIFFSLLNIAVAVITNVGTTCGNRENKVADSALK